MYKTSLWTYPIVLLFYAIEWQKKLKSKEVKFLRYIVSDSMLCVIKHARESSSAASVFISLVFRFANVQKYTKAFTG